MNKVDHAIAMTMLQYPSRFLTRWSVLFEMFFVYGAGTTWDNKGCLVNIFEKDHPHYKAACAGIINCSEVQDRIARIEQSIKQYAPLRKAYLAELADLQFQLAGLRHRGANIRKFAQQHLADPRDYDLSEFETVWTTGTAISAVPFDHLHKEWAQALDEVVTIVYTRMQTAFKLGDKPLLKDIPKKWQPLFRQIRDVRQQLAERKLVKAPGRLVIAAFAA